MKKVIIAIALCLVCTFSFGFIQSNQIVYKALTEFAKEVKLYASPTGQCYHYSQKCGGKNAVEITAQQAQDRGLRACKKCVH